MEEKERKKRMEKEERGREKADSNRIAQVTREREVRGS